MSGLRSGLLTFGGAYTVLPFLRRDAVEVGRWMTDREFLDGVAPSGSCRRPSSSSRLLWAISGAVGLIAATSLARFQQAVWGPVAGIMFTLALIVLSRWKAKTAVAAVILVAGGVGLLLLR